MRSIVLRWVAWTALLVALVAGIHVIVERNNAVMNPPVDSPAGFVH